jgi:hypothetical protein
MKKRLVSIAKRRQLLVAQVAQQRELLVNNIKPLQKSLSWADNGLKVLRYVKKHPILILGITALIAFQRPTRALKWIRRSWVAALAIRVLRTRLTKN